jgi:putative PIN family toxin of toxin-antitoxin system
MNANRRVVFDTSTLVGAALRPASPANRAFSLALRHGVICICEPSLERLRSVLSRSKLDRYLGKRARIAFVDLLANTAWSCLVSEAELSAIRPPCRDRRNHVVLTLATTAEADAIVSSDEDLLARKAWRKIPIVTPSGFAAWYDAP